MWCTTPSTLFSAFLTENILPVPLIEHWSVTEVESWERSRTSGVLQGRQQHLHTVEGDDWGSITSFCRYLKQVCPCQAEDTETERGSQSRQHACQVGHSLNFSSAPLIRRAEKQWPAENKQWTQSQFTFSDIPVILQCGRTLQWLMSFILGGCLNITHKVVMPVLPNAQRIVAWVMGLISFHYKENSCIIFTESVWEVKWEKCSFILRCVWYSDTKGQSVSPRFLFVSNLDKRLFYLSDEHTHQLWIRW